MIISKTPVRISFAGGGTDIKEYFQQFGGVTISTTIDKYIYVIIKRRFDKKIRVGYTQTELVDSVDEIKHELVRECLKRSGIESGVEIETMADIPSEGSGLGSSSAVTVGLLNAMYAYRGIPLDSELIAKFASRIEIEELNKPIGYQDQYICSYGGMRMIEYTADGIYPAPRFPNEITEQFGKRLLMFYTGNTRKSETILTQQKANIQRNLRLLSKTRQFAEQITNALTCKHFDVVGCMMHDAWELKKKLADGISNDEIDSMYNKARNAGALGGKLGGAGSSGFLILYVREESQDEVRDALHDYQELPFNIESRGSRIVFDDQ